MNNRKLDRQWTVSFSISIRIIGVCIIGKELFYLLLSLRKIAVPFNNRFIRLYKNNHHRDYFFHIIEGSCYKKKFLENYFYF